MIVTMDYLHEVGLNDVVLWQGKKFFIIQQILSDKVALQLPRRYPRKNVADASKLKAPKALLFQAVGTPSGIKGSFTLAPLDEIQVVLSLDAKQLLQYAQKFAKHCKIDTPIEIEENEPESLQSAIFDPNQEIIRIYPKSFYKQYSHDFAYSDVPLDLHLTIILAHEFGHAVDPFLKQNASRWSELASFVRESVIEQQGKRNFTRKEKLQARRLYSSANEFYDMKLQFEKNAVRLGRPFVPKVLLDLYDEDAAGLLRNYEKEKRENLQAIAAMELIVSAI